MYPFELTSSKPFYHLTRQAEWRAVDVAASFVPPAPPILLPFLLLIHADSLPLPLTIFHLAFPHHSSFCLSFVFLYPQSPFSSINYVRVHI